MHYTHAFFDLDGTLIDSSPGITHSVQYALERSGITPPAAEELTCFIGPPLLDSFCRYFDSEKNFLFRLFPIRFCVRNERFVHPGHSGFSHLPCSILFSHTQGN